MTEPRQAGTQMEHASDAERAVLERVPTGLLIDGVWREAAGSGRLAVEDPATEETLLEVADARPQDAMDALARGGTRAGAVGGARPARARRDPAACLRGADRAQRRARAADDARDGQGAARVERGDRVRRGVLPLVLRGGGARPRPLHGQHDGQRAHLDDAPARRPVRARDAMELPDGDGRAQDRAGDRGGVHDGRQAGPADAALDARARGDPRRRQACRRACSTS